MSLSVSFKKPLKNAFLFHEENNIKARLMHEFLYRKLYQQAMQSVYQEGIQKGQEAVLQQYQVSMETLQKICEDIHEQQSSIIKQMKNQLIQLAVDISKKILLREITLDSNIEPILAESIQQAGEFSKVKIYINPDDYQKISKDKERFQKIFSDEKTYQVVQDLNIRSGGCIVETKTATIDATVDSKLEKIYQDLIRGE